MTVDAGGARLPPRSARPGSAAVAMRGIVKRFPAVVANDGVDFEAAAGEVHAVLGENGAGKSTLSNILTGLYRPDEGEIELYGQRAHIRAPLAADRAARRRARRAVPPEGAAARPDLAALGRRAAARRDPEGAL